MEQTNQRSTTFLRGDSNISTTASCACLSLRMIVTALVVLNVIFIGLFGGTFYFLFELKQQCNSNTDVYRNGINTNSPAHSGFRSRGEPNSTPRTDDGPSKGENSHIKISTTFNRIQSDRSFDKRREKTVAPTSVSAGNNWNSTKFEFVI